MCNYYENREYKSVNIKTIIVNIVFIFHNTSKLSYINPKNNIALVLGLFYAVKGIYCIYGINKNKKCYDFAFIWNAYCYGSKFYRLNSADSF